MFLNVYLNNFVNYLETSNCMQTLFRAFGLRFFFYSNEHEPIHLHVRNADGEAKFDVERMK